MKSLYGTENLHSLAQLHLVHSAQPARGEEQRMSVVVPYPRASRSSPRATDVLARVRAARVDLPVPRCMVVKLRPHAPHRRYAPAPPG